MLRAKLEELCVETRTVVNAPTAQKLINLLHSHILDKFTPHNLPSPRSGTSSAVNSRVTFIGECTDWDGTTLWGYVRSSQTPIEPGTSQYPMLFVNNIFKTYLEENPSDTSPLRQLFFVMTIIHALSHSLHFGMFGPEVRISSGIDASVEGPRPKDGGWFVVQKLFGADLLVDLEKGNYQSFLGTAFSPVDAHADELLVVKLEMALATLESLSTDTIIPFTNLGLNSPSYASPQPPLNSVRIPVLEGVKAIQPPVIPIIDPSNPPTGRMPRVFQYKGRPDSIIVGTGGGCCRPPPRY
ncbi:hypothetical protein JAAARDRAFT_191198 [Jaapia argillacea MUCL 33604]|uniref:Uncharacterized protein n=1 Tax=Jaapia argillacea MUCL 33604 TaxID=933084 RepID=A0A067Q4J0_9AGAM|nr:hypothetical protein JAAARDRAFT_191198 [Jaapia argillacea MUCL 33604]